MTEIAIFGGLGAGNVQNCAEKIAFCKVYSCVSGTKEPYSGCPRDAAFSLPRPSPQKGHKAESTARRKAGIVLFSQFPFLIRQPFSSCLPASRRPPRADRRTSRTDPPAAAHYWPRPSLTPQTPKAADRAWSRGTSDTPLFLSRRPALQTDDGIACRCIRKSA
jgi:hypothetical protein